MQSCDKQNIKNIESLLRSDKMKELAINNGVTLSVNTSYHTTDYATTHLIVEPINPESNIANFMMDIKSSLVDKIGIPISYRYNSPTVRSLVISYNADSLSKIKGEQVKKRDEQGDFDSIAVKEGVDNIFKENSELSKIGTQQQYSDYLDTIFPDSKVKEIVYRGTPENYPIKKGISPSLGEGITFTSDKEWARSYTENGSAPTLHTVLINIKNPIVLEDNIDKLSENKQNAYIKQRNNKVNDGVISLNEYLVIEPEQIHILGSKKDIEGFKEFVAPKQGVQELFDSNPELANEVYEALGFKTESSSNTITRDIKEELPFKVIGNYNEIDEGLIGRKFYEEKIGNDLYRFEISNYSYPNEDGSSESFYDIDFTVNGSEEVIGTGFFDKAERAKQILQALLSQNFGNDTVRFNVEESKKGKQRLSLYKRLMNQLGYNPSGEMEYALFYNTNTFLSPSDKIVFGHPTIGKSYLKQKGNNEFITLDDDYADEVNAFVDANRGSETRQEYKGRKPKEYNQFMLNLFDRLKIQAQKEGKKLFVSNTNILKERMSDFDKVITMPKDEFKKRFDARGATYGFEDWKSDIDATVAKVPINKIINTTGYLSDLFKPSNEIGKINLTPQQKQQAQQLYAQYLESLNNPNTNPILQGNQTNVEEIITQLEKDGLLEIDCKGKIKAEKGLATSFVKGGKWKVIKDLKGYPTHKEGGVDLTIGKGGVSIKNGNTQITAAFGLVIPMAADGMVVPDGEDNPIIEPINEPNVELTNNTFDGGPDDPKIKSKSKKQIYQEAIKNNYKTYVGQGVKTPYMKDGVDTEKGHMNCINGVCNVIEGMGAKKFNSKYSGNAKFSDAHEQEGYYIANPENDGFEVGDVIQYARYKNSALSRFPGKVDAKNGYDLYPNHAKVVLDTYKDAEGNNRYILGHNKGTDQFTQEEVSETDLLEVARGKGMNSYNGLIVNRYDPDNVTKLKKENFEATQVLSGKNKYAKDYDTASGIKGVSFETVIDPKKPATYQSTPEANKLVDIYNKNYKAIGKMSDLPPAILNKLIHSQIGIASMESKIGKDEGGVKSLVPDVALPLARKLKDKVSDSDDWMKDYYDKNVKGVKEKYKTLDAFRQKMDEGNRLDKDAREYLYYHSERSKGTFQQKMLSKRGRYMNLDLDNPDQQPLASLNLAIDNFHLLKKKYPNLNEDELVDLTTLMHNAPSKALNQDYVDYYLKNKQIDYVNAVNKKKGKIEENVQTKAKYVPKPIVKNLSKKEVEDLTNFAKKLK